MKGLGKLLGRLMNLSDMYRQDLIKDLTGEFDMTVEDVIDPIVDKGIETGTLVSDGEKYGYRITADRKEVWPLTNGSNS